MPPRANASWRPIEQLNYHRPNGSARGGLRGPAGKSVGVVIKEAQNPYYSEILAGIRKVVAEKGYLTILSSSEGHLKEEIQVVKQLSDKDLSGLIITPILNEETDLAHIFDLKRSHIPFVLLESVRGLQASLVDVDNTGASQEVVRHLIDLGHERIVHFAGPPYSEHTKERIAGVRRAFSESPLIYDSQVIVQVGDSFADGYERGINYFGQKGAGNIFPTAVSCYNDLVALGLMKALRELGISVPEEISVVGFDDLDLLDYFPGALTTVHVPKREMGRQAAELLIQQIDSGTSSAPTKVSLDATLVERSSTAPPRESTS